MATEFGYGNEVLIGVVAGVSAGLILATLATIYNIVNNKIERHKQIQFFIELTGIMKKNCDDPAEPKSEKVEISADHWRFFHLRNHVRHFRHALDERSTRLSFDEIYEGKDALYEIEVTLDYLQSRLPELPKGACSELVSRFEKISWLRR